MKYLNTVLLVVIILILILFLIFYDGRHVHNHVHNRAAEAPAAVLGATEFLEIFNNEEVTGLNNLFFLQTDTTLLDGGTDERTVELELVINFVADIQTLKITNLMSGASVSSFEFNPNILSTYPSEITRSTTTTPASELTLEITNAVGVYDSSANPTGVPNPRLGAYRLAKVAGEGFMHLVIYPASLLPP